MAPSSPRRGPALEEPLPGAGRPSARQAAAAAAYAKEAYSSTGKLYYTPEKFEFQLVPNDQQTTDWLYYVDKVEESLEPGRDPKKSKYIDPTSGLPIAPKSYKDLLSRGNDPSVQMWLKAGEEVSRTWLRTATYMAANMVSHHGDNMF